MSDIPTLRDLPRNQGGEYRLPGGVSKTKSSIPPYVYACGFYPGKKPFAVVIEHWTRCPHPNCQQALSNYREFSSGWFKRYRPAERPAPGVERGADR